MHIKASPGAGDEQIGMKYQRGNVAGDADVALDHMLSLEDANENPYSHRCRRGGFRIG